MDQNQNYQNQNQNQNYQNQNQNQNYQNQNQGQNYQNQNQGQNYRSANNTQVPPAAPVTPADPVPTPKAKSKKPLIIAIIAIIVVAALAVGAYFLLQGKDSNKQGNQTPSIDDIGSRAPDEISTFALYPDSDVDKSDLEEFSELINERVQLLGTDNKLTSGKDYRIDVEDERIILTIVKDLLGNTPAEKTAIVDLLISKGNLCFGVDGYALTSTPHKDAVAETSVTEVNRKDILEEYGDDIMTERYDQLEALSEDTLYALEVELTTDGEEDYLYTFNYFSGKPTVVHNFVEGIVSAETEYVSFLGTCLTPDEDEPGTLLIISPGSTSENTAELMKMVIEQDEMPFGLAMQIEDEPAWEEKAASGAGKNMVESIDNGIIIEWSPDDFTRSYYSEDMFSSFKTVIKSRMDTLGIDYMFGTKGFDDNTYCLKVNPKDFAPDFIRLIFNTGGDEIVSAFSSDLYEIGSFSKVVETNGKYALRFESYYSKDEILSDYASIANDTIYLVVNDVTVASANMNDIVADGSRSYIDFSNFTCFDDATAGEDEKYILDLLKHIFKESYLGSFEGSYYFRSDEVSGTASLGALDWKYSSITETDNITFRAIKNMCYSVDKKVDSRNMLTITLDLPINNNLPTNFANKVKEIYNKAGFDNGAYAKIEFVIKDETKNSPADEFRIVFTKNAYEGKMMYQFSASGPEFDEYWSDTYDLLQEDYFFMAHTYSYNY